MKKTTHSRARVARHFLLFWCLFIGIGAVGGSVGMLVRTDGSAMGMQALLPYFQVLPLADLLFQNFLFPGIALLCVNGLPNLIAAALLLRKRQSGIVMGGILGLTLMAWITIQFVIFPANFMSITYFIFGILQAVTGYAAFVFARQEAFREAHAEETVFTPVDARELIVYFSRMGYTRHVAWAIAKETGAALCEIRATEPTAGTGGFWWCGRFGMHGWDMPIEPLTVELEKYDKVTVCTPVWVFGVAGPIRSFCRAARGKVRRADYVAVHFMNARLNRLASDLDALLGIRHEAFRSIRCRMGVCRELPVCVKKEAKS